MQWPLIERGAVWISLSPFPCCPHPHLAFQLAISIYCFSFIFHSQTPKLTLSASFPFCQFSLAHSVDLLLSNSTRLFELRFRYQHIFPEPPHLLTFRLNFNARRFNTVTNIKFHCFFSIHRSVSLDQSLSCFSFTFPRHPPPFAPSSLRLADSFPVLASSDHETIHSASSFAKLHTSIHSKSNHARFFSSLLSTCSMPSSILLTHPQARRSSLSLSCILYSTPTQPK